eukprot:scaffold16117_cov18-Tisochrysis_lutea.AAC.1
MQETYLRIRHRTLESDILKEFSGKERKFFLGLINVGVNFEGMLLKPADPCSCIKEARAEICLQWREWHQSST